MSHATRRLNRLQEPRLTPRASPRGPGWILSLVLIWISAGCSPSLRESAPPVAATGMEPRLVGGAGFAHVTYRHHLRSSSGRLHVYLEGDGRPWLTRNRIAKDPTPRVPLALRLMAQDPTPSLYLGRPCYHGLAQSPGCSPWMWTQGRYSDTVVNSMAAALHHALGSGAQTQITLIGYSGGGALAMLMAARLDNVKEVITIAANLDTDAWTDYHGYSRLRGSRNPTIEPALTARVRQIHLAGAQDVRVPLRVAQPARLRQPTAQFLTVPGFDHTCCWERAWPAILAALKDPSHAFEPESLKQIATAAIRD